MALNLTDNWKMAKILTDTWHLYPPPPQSRPSKQANKNARCHLAIKPFFGASPFDAQI